MPASPSVCLQLAGAQLLMPARTFQTATGAGSQHADPHGRSAPGRAAVHGCSRPKSDTLYKLSFKSLAVPPQVPIGRMKIPMVDLPLGATEDRVCGTIDIEKALTEGEQLPLVLSIFHPLLERTPSQAC